MSHQQPSQLALSALLLCTLVHQTAGSHRNSSTSSAEVRGRITGGTVSSWLKQSPGSAHGSPGHESRPSAKTGDVSGQVNPGIPVSTSGGSNTTISTEGFGRPDEGVSPICAYRVIEGGIWGQLCFRRTLFGYKCHRADCRTEVSLGNLVANLLVNGSVLLQWTSEEKPTVEPRETPAGGTRSRDATSRARAGWGQRRHGRGGYELSCWWNGSYTQFECASVHLGTGCRDFLLEELHENIPYRICLRSLAGSDPDKGANKRDCVEFTLPPSGMQDIVIAMTTVGGAICVMLVIICLLVAYITENIMSPTQHTQHTYSYCTHSRH